MKDKIQSFGDKFISIIAILSYLAVIVSGFGTMQASFLMGLMTIIGGVVSVTMLFYGIFIMIDIRDSLREIKNKN